MKQENYDFEKLVAVEPRLQQYLKKINDRVTIDFGSARAVRLLNKAILHSEYDISYWEFDESALTPPIPGRRAYIDQVVGLLSEHRNSAPKGNKVKVLDIGVGASCIYPIIGHRAYGWSFVGSDIEAKSITQAKEIIANNPSLRNISIKHQTGNKILDGIIAEGEYYEATICNPPFYSSAEEAERSRGRKNKNLGLKESDNYRGSSSELWTEGGELGFISQYIDESKAYRNQVLWFTSLVSAEKHIKPLQRKLEEKGAADSLIKEMKLGNKRSRIICWTYLEKKKRKAWAEMRF